tara:strand:+ start:261 stop:458 length:198 start_codon:yes stop_codon:yes gene_type:complete
MANVTIELNDEDISEVLTELKSMTIVLGNLRKEATELLQDSQEMLRDMNNLTADLREIVEPRVNE